MSDEWLEAKEISMFTPILGAAAGPAAVVAGMTMMSPLVEEPEDMTPPPRLCCMVKGEEKERGGAGGGLAEKRKERETGEAGQEGKRARKKNAKSQGRLPMYNLKQIEAWIQGCGDQDTEQWGGNTESERALVYERLVSLVAQMTPKMHTHPSPGCRCSLCTAYCSWIIQEGQFLGYDMRLIPGHVAHMNPRISQRHS